MPPPHPLLKSPARAAAALRPGGLSGEERRRGKAKAEGKGGSLSRASTCVGRQAIYSARIIHLSSQQPCEINPIIISLLWDEGGQGASERLRDTFGSQVAGSCHTCSFGLLLLTAGLELQLLHSLNYSNRFTAKHVLLKMNMFY